MDDNSREARKRRAAARAAAEIRDGMVLGLGSGSTVAFVFAAIAERIAAGLRVSAIPSSRKTALEARRLRIPLTSFATHRRIDLTIDGADQIERGSLALVKGLGGALTREKMIASASETMVVVADDGKLVARLGAATPLPVEILRFGWPVILDRLAALDAAPRLRMNGRKPFVTDNGNHIADCAFAAIPDAARLDAALRAVTGVIETGLFLGLATRAIVGTGTGVEILTRSRRP